MDLFNRQRSYIAQGRSARRQGRPTCLLQHRPNRATHVTVRAAKVKPNKSKKSSTSQPTSKKGFGPVKQSQQQEAEPWEAELLAPYKVYYKPTFKPSRFTGPIELKKFEDGSVGVVTAEEASGAELLIVSHPVAYLEGSMGTAPSVEDLHIAMLEADLGPNVTKVLSYLPQKPAAVQAAAAAASASSSSSSSSAPQQQQQQQQQESPPSFAHLQPQFWAEVSKGAGAFVVEKLSSRQLLRLLQASCWSEEFQDPAASQVRHERPQGFIGVWPELSMLRHSCAPNSSVVVVSRFLLLHATSDLAKGEEVTFNKLGSAVAAPLAVRQAAHLELFGRPCTCSRCTLEAALPAAATQQLQSVHDQAQGAWPQRLQAALESAEEADPEETAEALAELQAELSESIEALNATLAQSVPNQDHRLALLCAVYNAYDLNWQMEELLAEQPDLDKLANAVALLRIFAPGSEGHVYTSLLLHQACVARAEELLAEANRTRSAVRQRRMTVQMQLMSALGESAVFAHTEAISCRYGMLPQEGLIPQLEQGLTLFYAGLSALSAAQGEGSEDVPEVTREITIEGIPVTVVDTVEGSAFSQPGGEGQHQVTVKGQQQRGLKVDWLEADVQQDQLTAARS